VFVKDVGEVHDGWLVQQNMARQNGRRSVLLSIIKNGNASTLDEASKVKAAIETIRRPAPPGMKIHELFDQSVLCERHCTAYCARALSPPA
jgi:multidrug efflux pump subunit AcrB